jgi:hypothetical protein
MCVLHPFSCPGTPPDPFLPPAFMTMNLNTYCLQPTEKVLTSRSTCVFAGFVPQCPTATMASQFSHSSWHGRIRRMESKNYRSQIHPCRDCHMHACLHEYVSCCRTRCCQRCWRIGQCGPWRMGSISTSCPRNSAFFIITSWLFAGPRGSPSLPTSSMCLSCLWASRSILLQRMCTRSLPPRSEFRFSDYLQLS